MLRACVRACRLRGRAERELAGRLAVVMVQPNVVPLPLVSPRPPFLTLATPFRSPATVVYRFVSLR